VLLVGLGPAARATVPDLLRVLKEEDPATRLRAACTLVGVAPDSAAPAVPALVEALASTNRDHQLAAAVAAGKIGRAARATVPGLRAALADTFGAIRLEAADSLVKIDRAEAKSVVPALVEMLEQPTFNRRGFQRRAILALGRLGPDASAALPAL